ncbi:Uncharacterized protein BM_BM17659 [Brugia malayi]|uniref:Uncharacterized protein n=1 Tax=Brugia malayi TaxID=6279 RepID=A0A4E9FKW8_BRUMA|nr:Uncharacterized protein BM_BM17659 [Brugia malayi]VIO96949.1 Uncharacterized protein BM_BM17659 [Brugia malayi]
MCKCIIARSTKQRSQAIDLEMTFSAGKERFFRGF